MATTTERLQIIIEALNLSRDEMKQLQQDLEGTKAGAKQSTSQIGGMRSALSTLTAVAGTATAAFFTMKKAFDLAEQGAQLELMDDRLNRLAQTIGTTGDRLREDLANTMGDITSRAEQTKVAVDLLSLGLVDNQEQLARLARVASQLDFDMNQLVLTLTNQTIRRFDQLGVSVDGFDEKVEELSETMSDQDAFTMAFIEQAEEQVEKLGDVSETAAGQFKEAQANWKDFTDNVKRGTLKAILPATRAFNKISERTETINEALEKNIITQKEFNEHLVRTGGSSADYEGLLELIRVRQKELRYEIELGNVALEGANRRTAELNQTSSEFIIKQGEMTQEAKEFAEAQLEAKESTKGWLDELDRDIDSPIENFIEDLRWYMATGGRIEEAFKAIQNLSEDVVTPGLKFSLAGELLLGTLDVQAELGQMTDKEAWTRGAEALKMDVSEVKDLITGTDSIEEAMRRVDHIAQQAEGIEGFRNDMEDAYGFLQQISSEQFIVDIILNPQSWYRRGRANVGTGFQREVTDNVTEQVMEGLRISGAE